MNHPPAPATGAISSCPCALTSIKPSLQALASKARAQGGSLTPTQSQLYSQLEEAWRFYRDSQPLRFRGEVDGLCDAIGDLPVVVGAVA